MEPLDTVLAWRARSLQLSGAQQMFLKSFTAAAATASSLPDIPIIQFDPERRRFVAVQRTSNSIIQSGKKKKT